MSRRARFAALVLAAALGVGALWVYQAGTEKSRPVVFMLGLQAALIVIGTQFEARYRGRKTAASGQLRDTGEREVDHETGTILEVWYDPATGERRYQPAGLRSHKSG